MSVNHSSNVLTEDMQTYHLLKNFYELSVIEVSIIDYLHKVGNVKINYTELSKKTAYWDARRTQLAVRHLEELGIIKVKYKFASEKEMKAKNCVKNPMIACGLNPLWMDELGKKILYNRIDSKIKDEVKNEIGNVSVPLKVAGKGV